MKKYIVIIAYFFVFVANAQSTTFGGSTSLYLSDGTTFFFGGSTTLNGDLVYSKQIEEFGTSLIVSYGDIDFTKNDSIGNIKFTGRADQEIKADTSITIETGDFIVDKEGKLTLSTKRIIVSGSLKTTNGVIDAEDEDDILVSGSSDDLGAGYVEGKLVGISKGGPVTFPMGVNGSPNYLTISDLTAGNIVSVECRIPDQNTLFPDDEMVGISDEVEWIIKVNGDSTEAQISVNFSGVDLENFSNGEAIRAFEYEPALVLFSKEDTLYHALNGTVTNRNSDLALSSGVITSTDNILITNGGRRLSIALIPIIVDPTFYVPKAFAPNATIGENRIFRPYFAGALVSSISITVYDSFNKEVYRVNQSGEELDISQYGWDGVLNSGQNAPEGVYYYTVRIIAESEEYTQTGSVLLVK